IYFSYTTPITTEIYTLSLHDALPISIKTYYESDYAPKMEAQHILVETEEEANSVIERLNNGEKFEDLAKELSTDSSSADGGNLRSEEHTSELQSRFDLVCRLLLEKKK